MAKVSESAIKTVKRNKCKELTHLNQKRCGGRRMLNVFILVVKTPSG